MSKIANMMVAGSMALTNFGLATSEVFAADVNNAAGPQCQRGEVCVPVKAPVARKPVKRAPSVSCADKLDGMALRLVQEHAQADAALKTVEPRVIESQGIFTNKVVAATMLEVSASAGCDGNNVVRMQKSAKIDQKPVVAGGAILGVIGNAAGGIGQFMGGLGILTGKMGGDTNIDNSSSATATAKQSQTQSQQQQQYQQQHQQQAQKPRKPHNGGGCNVCEPQ